MNKLSIEISSYVDNIVFVEHFINDFSVSFNLPNALLGRVNVAVIEAVSNAVFSGNKCQVDKTVTLEASLLDTKLAITVNDEGAGFDYFNIPDPTLPGEMCKMTGRGLYLMKILSDDLIFERGGASVTLFFNCNIS